MIAVVLFNIAALFGLPQTLDRPEDVKKILPQVSDVSAEPLPDTVSPGKEVKSPEQPTEKPLDTPEPAISEDKPPVSDPGFFQRYWYVIRWIGTLMPFIIFLFIERNRRNRRKLFVHKHHRKKPLSVWPIHLEKREPGFIKKGQFYSATHLLRQRLKGEAEQLDVEKTVNRSIELAGFSGEFCYSHVTRPPEYLILIDLPAYRILIDPPAYRDHYAHLSDTMVNALENEDIIVFRYFYESDPRVCFRDVSEEREYLSDLQARFAHCRVIIFGNAEELLDPISGELDKWTEVFQTWQDRGILTSKRPQNWGMREITLAREFILLPASLDGLVAMAEHFGAGDEQNLRAWKKSDSSMPDLKSDKLNDPAELREYLGEETFQWLCACAVYPEIHWNMTLYFGTLPCMGDNLVTEENLLRLIRLPWFVEGAMPDALRQKLINELDGEKIEGIQTAVFDLLEKGAAKEESFAYDSHRPSLVVHKRRRIPFKEWWKLRKEMKSVDAKEVVQDYTLVRFLEAVPESRLSLTLPRRFRDVFYSNGVPRFGLKTGIRLILAMLVAIIAFVFTKEPLLVISNNSSPFVAKKNAFTTSFPVINKINAQPSQGNPLDNLELAIKNIQVKPEGDYTYLNIDIEMRNFNDKELRFKDGDFIFYTVDDYENKKIIGLDEKHKDIILRTGKAPNREVFRINMGSKKSKVLETLIDILNALGDPSTGFLRFSIHSDLGTRSVDEWNYSQEKLEWIFRPIIQKESGEDCDGSHFMNCLLFNIQGIHIVSEGSYSYLGIVMETKNSNENDMGAALLG